MSSINVNTIKSRLGGPPTLPSGVVVSAAATFNNDVSIGGTLTYEDVTSVDVVGLITARSGIKFGVAGVGGTIDGVGNAIISGITTVGTALSLADNVQARFGDAGDLAIYHNATNSYIDNSTGHLYLRSNTGIDLTNAAGSKTMIEGTNAGEVSLYYNNAKKFETHNTGVKVTGIATISSDAFVGSAITMYASSGIVSATSYYGDGSNLEGVSASGGGALDITSCLFI